MGAKHESTRKKRESSFPPELVGRVPASLIATFSSTLPSYDGMIAFGVPESNKLAVRFDPEAAWSVMTTYGGGLPETRDLVPLAALGRTRDRCFAVDPSKPELPVYYFEQEAGYRRFSSSLDELLSSLLKRGVKSPLEKLERVTDDADALSEKNEHAAVIALLEPAVAQIARKPHPTLLHALNLLGMAYRHTGALDRAIATFEEAWTLGEGYAALNLCDLYEELEDFPRCLATAESLTAQTSPSADAYEWFWARSYLGSAAIRVGDEPRALRAFGEIHTELGACQPEYVQTARDELAEIAAQGGLHGRLAEQVLTRSLHPHKLPHELSGCQ